MSKFSIRDQAQNIVVAYDRGWDIMPDSDTEKFFQAALTFLEGAPRRWPKE